MGQVKAGGIILIRKGEIVKNKHKSMPGQEVQTWPWKAMKIYLCNVR